MFNDWYSIMTMAITSDCATDDFIMIVRNAVAENRARQARHARLMEHYGLAM